MSDALYLRPWQINDLDCLVATDQRIQVIQHDEVGDVIGIRGPYGNNFPVDDWRGKNLMFIGGDLAPIWLVITTAVAQRTSFKNITVLYGGRTSRDYNVPGRARKVA